MLKKIVVVFTIVLISSCGYSAGSEQTTEAESKKTPAKNEVDQDFDTRKATVEYVFDGDTFKVHFQDNGEEVPIRVKGIDCPESSRDVQKCWSNDDRIEMYCPEQVKLGKKVTKIARKRLEGKMVTLESYKNFKRDPHNRILAYVRMPNNKDYGLGMVKDNYCRAFNERFDNTRSEQYMKYDEPLSLDH